MDEREAISRLKQGDVKGLETLVSKYQVEAIKAAYLITGDRYAAEDVVATAFLRVYERFHQFDSTRPFRPWFLRIVANDAIKVVSRRSRQVSLDHTREDAELALRDVLSSQGPGPEDLAERAELRRKVWEAIQSLPPSQRSVIVLRYYLGLKQSEVSEQLGSSPGAVKRYLHEGRRHLRTLLESLRPVQ